MHIVTHEWRVTTTHMMVRQRGVTAERSELPWIIFLGTLFHVIITRTRTDLTFLSRLGSTICITNFGSHNPIVLYWIPCYMEPCYKGSLLYWVYILKCMGSMKVILQILSWAGKALIHSMAADGLTTGARVPAAMVLTKFIWNILVSAAWKADCHGYGKFLDTIWWLEVESTLDHSGNHLLSDSIDWTIQCWHVVSKILSFHTDALSWPSKYTRTMGGAVSLVNIVLFK